MTTEFLIVLILWVAVLFLWVRSMLSHKYKYYNASVVTKKSSFESDEVPFDYEKSNLNLRQSMRTGRWQVYRKHWKYLIPSLSFLFSEKVRRFGWQLVPFNQITGIEQSIQKQKEIEITFPYCDESAQLEAKDQLRKIRLDRAGGNIFSELRKSQSH